MTDMAVIMSVYHNDKLEYLEKSVQSILNQTFTQFHYYIAFDGPVSDDINTYISSLKDNRIKLFRLENNEGLASALNYLLKIVLKNPDYEFIARMDADDISFPSRFEKQRDFFMNNSNVSILGCWYQEIDDSGKHLADRKLPIEHEALKKRYYTRAPLAHPSVMFRKKVVEITGLYKTDTFLMEDNVLWGQALKAGLRFANIPEYLLKFRKDEEFYKRRSGVKYGWNFITTRFKINRLLKFPFYFYFFSLIIGIIKMMPAFFLRYLYLAFRKL